MFAFSPSHELLGEVPDLPQGLQGQHAQEREEQQGRDGKGGGEERSGVHGGLAAVWLDGGHSSATSFATKILFSVGKSIIVSGVSSGVGGKVHLGRG